MAMHVLQLGPIPPPEGGVSRNMLSIRSELLRQGHRCSLIATSSSSEIVPEANVYHPKGGAELLRLLRSIDFDVVHLHVGGVLDRRVLALALAVSVFGRGRAVLTIHSGAYPLTPEALAATPSSLRGVIFRRFRQIIGVNDGLVDVFLRYGVEKNRVRKILPFSTTLPDPDVQVPEDLKAFIKEYSPAMLAVGGLEADYDPFFQIEAMDEIVEKLPNAGLMIVGDGSMRADVEARVAANRHKERIMIPGNVDHSIVLHLIRSADILLRTTLFDGDAISIREALSLGTPVVATDTGMRPDGVSLTPMHDREALVQAISDAFATGRRTGIESPSNENIEAVIDLYRELIEAK